jgi:hypothetical protein
MAHIVLTEEQERILEQAKGPVEVRDSRGRSVARVLPLLPAGAQTTWEEWYKKIESCKALQEGWNGYTAPVPSERAITLAKRFLDAMQSANLLPTRVGPSAMGGIAVTRKVGMRKVLVECYNDGGVFALLSDRRTDDLPVEEVKDDPGSFAALITKMREFLDG